MKNNSLIFAVLALFLLVATLPFWYKALTPWSPRTVSLELPKDKKQCVEETAWMRTSHVQLLTYWQEAVVREDKRTYTASNGQQYTMSMSGTCIGCHQKKETFCDRCHDYVQVKPRCWECHVYQKQ